MPPHGADWYLVDGELTAGPLVLDGVEGRHAATVKRARTGETLVLTDGRGNWAPATVIGTDRGTVRLESAAPHHVPPPAVTVTAVQALPKGERSELAVELLTEAGVDRIVPWQAQRCVARWVGPKVLKGQQKWQQAARQAAKQSRRPWVPVVDEPAGTAELATLVRDADLALVLHEDAAESVALQDIPLPSAGTVLLVIGPEGGVCAAELQALTGAGARPARLGPQVLRTSTAGAVALGALGVLTDRWRPTDPASVLALPDRSAAEPTLPDRPTGREA
nr:16S rRNA (uracil(1498)-N(3))-methyltransferase [Nakamurella aerolata]